MTRRTGKTLSRDPWRERAGRSGGAAAARRRRGAARACHSPSACGGAAAMVPCFERAWLAVCARPATRAFTRASAFSIARSSFCGDFFVCGTQRARAQRPVSAAPWPRAVKTTFVAVVEAALASNAQAAFTEEVVLHRTMSNPCVPRVSKSVDSNPRQLSQLSQL